MRHSISFGSLIALSLLSACPSSCPSQKTVEAPPAGLAGASNDGLPNYNALSDKALAEAKKDRPILSGKVLEVITKENFSYLRVQIAGKGEEWIAVLSSDIVLGQDINVEEQVVLTDFHSKSLNRTFPKIIFGAIRK